MKHPVTATAFTLAIIVTIASTIGPAAGDTRNERWKPTAEDLVKFLEIMKTFPQGRIPLESTTKPKVRKLILDLFLDICSCLQDECETRLLNRESSPRDSLGRFLDHVVYENSLYTDDLRRSFLLAASRCEYRERNGDK